MASRTSRSDRAACNLAMSSSSRVISGRLWSKLCLRASTSVARSARASSLAQATLSLMASGVRSAPGRRVDTAAGSTSSISSTRPASRSCGMSATLRASPTQMASTLLSTTCSEAPTHMRSTISPSQASMWSTFSIKLSIVTGGGDGGVGTDTTSLRPWSPERKSWWDSMACTRRAIASVRRSSLVSLLASRATWMISSIASRESFGDLRSSRSRSSGEVTVTAHGSASVCAIAVSLSLPSPEVRISSLSSCTAPTISCCLWACRASASTSPGTMTSPLRTSAIASRSCDASATPLRATPSWSRSITPRSLASSPCSALCPRSVSTVSCSFASAA
eukprot:Sspe_Gene.36975::Locus_17864_Transcript_1_1_Confidence_1.000_Length_7597::g.36975::m.36975